MKKRVLTIGIIHEKKSIITCFLVQFFEISLFQEMTIFYS